MREINLDYHYINAIKSSIPYGTGICSSVYNYNNDKVIKIFNQEILSDYKLMMDKRKKIMISDSFRDLSNDLILPEEAINSNIGFCAYTMLKNNTLSLKDYLFRNIDKLSDKDVAIILLAIEDIVKKGNEYGIVFTDIASFDNILFDSKTGKVTLLDYDDLQIKNITTDICSNILLYGSDDKYDILFNGKYVDEYTGLYTTNIEKLAIFTTFIGLTLGANITSIRNEYDEIKDFSKAFGISDTTLEETLFLMFDKNKSNEFVGERLISFADEYEVSRSLVCDDFGMHTKFVKKIK